MTKCKYCDNKAGKGNDYCDRKYCKLRKRMEEAITLFEIQKRDLLEKVEKDLRKQGLDEEEIKKKLEITEVELSEPTYQRVIICFPDKCVVISSPKDGDRKLFKEGKR